MQFSKPSKKEAQPGKTDFPLEGYDWASKVLIGKGSFSEVYRVKRKHSEQQVAIKQIHMSLFTDESQLQALRLQIELMSHLKSENIVAMYESVIGEHFSYIVMELCQSDLRQKLTTSNGKLPEKEAVCIYIQILKGFKFLISLGYIHRDIKPENIIIRGECYKVADFGFSCKADMNYIAKLDEVCGTPLYMAPQVLSEKAYTAKCDIWSLGIMLYEMVFGYGPWVCRNMESYRYNILNKPLSFPYNGKIGQNTKDFIKRCLVVNQEKRMGWKELFEHPFCSNNDPGEATSNIKIDKTAVIILKRIQESAARKSIDIMKPFLVDKKERLNLRNLGINLEQFQELCLSIDPTVSSFEIRMLFQAIDTSKDGNIDYEQFRKMMLDNDFRDVNDIANRCILEIIEIIKTRRIDANKLFADYDRNNSGLIEFDEFTKLVHEFLPKMPATAIQPIFDKFDKDKSGDISLKEFLFELTKGVTSATDTQQLLNEKAVRCLTALKAAVVYYAIDFNQLIKVFDTNRDSVMDFKEFSNMVYTIDKYLPTSELELIFNYIDQEKKGKINASTLKQMLT